MKKIVFLFLVSLILVSNSFASGVVRKAPQSPLASIIYKEFQVDDLSDEVFEHWIVLKTNPFDNKTDHHKHLHKRLLESWENNGWKAYYLPPYYGMYYDVADEEYIIILQMQAFNNLRRYRGHHFQKIVEYEIPVKADVEIVFESDNDRVFYALMPEFDPDPMFHTFKYRGKNIDDFFQETVFEKLENEIKRQNNYIEVVPGKKSKKHKRNL